MELSGRSVDWEPSRSQNLMDVEGWKSLTSLIGVPINFWANGRRSSVNG